MIIIMNKEININNNNNNNNMEKFIQAEVSRLINEYSKSKDKNILLELKQFIEHIPNLLG